MRLFNAASIAGLLVLGACKAPSPPGGFGVNLTIDSSALDPAVRSSISSATLHVSGDQPDPYTTALDIAKPLHAGKATFRYAPQVHSGSIDLHVDALDGNGAVVSSGDSGPVALTDGQTSTATVVLGAASPIDMSVIDAAVDLGAVDLAGADLLPPPDLKMPKNKGETCTVDADCNTGHCADGVCCESACADSCHACNLTGLAGTCSPVLAGDPPASGHPTCGPDATSTCARDGKCDGAGICRKYVSGTACGSQTCTAGTFTPAPTCDGNGTCKPSTNQACAPYVCNSATQACWGACTDNTQCSSPNTCVSASCGKKADGAMCASDSECLNNHCQQGYCCATVCTGTCMSCGVANKLGTCSPVPKGTPDPQGGCAGGTGVNATCAPGGCNGLTPSGCQYASSTSVCVNPTCSTSNNTETLQANCNGSGTCAIPAPATKLCGNYVCGATACKTTCAADTDCSPGNFCMGSTCVPLLAQGAACGGTNQCQAGLYCTDGVCCNASSCGTCQACNVTGAAGTCQIAAGQNPHGSCPTSPGPCQTSTCNGSGNCFQPNNTACGSSCSNAQLTSSVCMSGSCTAQPATACPNDFQCSSSTACATNCGADSDCISGYYCNSASQCVAKLANSASCTSNNQCQSGVCADGVCCNTACGGLCQACNVSGKEGTCSPIPSGQQPLTTHGTCTSDSSFAVCNGSCNGSNVTACTYPTSACGTSQCYLCSGITCLKPGYYAQAASSCSMGKCGATSTYCGKYGCEGLSFMGGPTFYQCRTSCTTDSQCYPGYAGQCVGSVCQ